MKLTDKELDAIIEQKVAERLKQMPTRRKAEFPVTHAGGPLAIGTDGANLYDHVRMPAELQIKADQVCIASKLLGRDPRSLKMWGGFVSEASEFTKAMAAATVGSGAEWIPDGFSAELLRAVKLELRVANLHRWIAMPQGMNKYTFPVEGGDITVELVSEPTSDTPTKFTASTPGTTNIEFETVKFARRVLTSAEMTEDAAYSSVEYSRIKIVSGFAEAVENCTINGDTAGTHQDSDVTDAKDHRKGFSGYRKLAISAAKVDCNTFNSTNLRAIRTGMGKYGMDPDKLAWIPGIAVYNKMLGLDEVITVDKLGPNATLLRGQLANFYGIPVIPSAKIRENLNAAGVYDGVTTNLSVLPLVYRPGFMFGEKREMTVRVLTELYAESDQICLTGTQRLDFKPAYDATTEPIVGLGYNITT